MIEIQNEYTKLCITPITLTKAFKFIKSYHRHHKPPQGGLFAISVTEENHSEPCGVAIIGRPVSRHLDNGLTVEVTRLCTLGHRNACSMLYRAAWRVASAMGYKKLITYTLPEEGGASCRAAGMNYLGEAGGGSWNSPSRPRLDKHPTQTKIKWEIADLMSPQSASGTSTRKISK